MSIRQKLQNNIFHVINLLTGRVAALERQMMRMQEEMDRNFAIQRQHLVRVKNNQELPDAFIQNGRPYHDLSPEKAWKLFQDPEFDFIFLDVSHEEFVPEGTRPRATLHIPLEQLEARWDEVPQQTTPLMIISEEGLRSILACEFLNSKNYFNCNNVSGGWKFWPGHRLHSVEKTQESA